MKDNIGVIAYGINQSTTTQPNYTTIEATTNATSSYTASAAGTYVIWVKDVAGRIATTSFIISQNLFCAFNPNQVWNFDYTGGVQSFTVPCNGTYKLEVWGAQGGSYADVNGGKGGYSTGNINLNNNSTIYIVVGGSGNGGKSNIGTANGGYNGGGNGHNSGLTGSGEQKDRYYGSGGGATHIATSNYGILSNYDTHRSDILIVAGGGGGIGGMEYDGCAGGTGGGTTGGTAETVGYSAIGGDQNGLYSDYPSWVLEQYSGSLGKFGLGSSAGTSTTNAYGSGGGGGGWYGGTTGPYSGGGGGSGYTGGVTNGSMQNGIREGNGYARITLVSIN